MSRFLFATSVAFALAISLAPQIAVAQTPDVLGLSYGAQSGLSAQDPRKTVALIIQVALGILGTITLGLIIYAGFLWLTSAGNEDKISQAKGIISAAVIGLVIILSAYAITGFVVKQLYQATTGTTYAP